MPANFSGKWVSGASEGWDKFLGKFGVPVEKFPADIVVTEEIAQSGDAINIKTSNNKDDKVKQVTINVGQNFKDTIGGGKELEFTTAWQGDKLVMTGIDGKGSVTRELSGGNMLVTFTHEGVVAKSTYNKA
ncbi:fatty acid-binding protein, intestinal-like [Acanthaster planci]|uniref:Fatty acid-binding protein, intestinal-like n=1 Tax=Acanthaster planci TaxID=133434 RepID=A0A8B7Y528_ACAPL|nr:fatty acid-binding protein, intestinal-like [Acanthaster planci]